MTGTLESHMRISQALGTTLVELYKGLSPAGRGAEVRVTKPEHDILIRGGDFSAEMLGARTSDKRMTPLLLRIGKNGQTPRDETKRGAEKFLYVLEGKVEVNLGDDERYPLHRGDTIYFDSSIPHRFRNTGGNEARLICVTSRPA
jgi:mannose-6-phosphate isomerase-like protein (cupin superfamily)